MYNLIPKFFRQRILKRRINNPIYVEKQGGLIVLTSVGMFAKTGGWIGSSGGITTLKVGLGCINKKLIQINDNIIEQEFLQVTLSLDHNIIDGAPAARFSSYLVDLIDSGDTFQELNS